MPSQHGKPPHTTWRLSTDDVAPGQRRSYWEECVARIYLEMSMKPLGDGPFQASLHAHALHNVTIAKCSTTALHGQRSVAVSGPVQDDRCLLLINLDGEIHLRHNARELSLRRHDMTLIDSRLPSEYRIPLGAQMLAVNMPRRALVERTPDIADIAATILPARLPLQPMTIGFFRNLFKTLDGASGLRPPTTLRLAGHALDMLGISLADALGVRSPASPYRSALLRRIKAFIDEHLHEPILGVQLVAAKYRVTPRYIAMLFQDEGTTFSDFVRRQRLERCRRQLEGIGPIRGQIGEIALAAGFVSQAHFSRLFRATYHTTPQQYRSAFRHDAFVSDADALRPQAAGDTDRRRSEIDIG